MTDPVTDPPPTTTTPPPPPSSTSTAIAVREVMSPADRYRYASSLAPARMLPGEIRGSTADVLLRVEYGYSLGLPPVAAIAGIHVIEGKPTASAGLMSAVVRAAGHRFRVWTEPDPAYPGQVKAIATIVRSDDPDFTYRVEWTVERAIAARLLRDADGRILAVKERSAWDTYRAGMLKARATTEVCRDACEDVLFGVHYTAEELGANTDAAGEYVEGEIVHESTTTPTTDPYAAPVPGTVEQGATSPDGPIVDPDLVGSAIRGALSKRQLVDNLVELGLAWADETARGGYVYLKDTLEAIEVVADEQTGQLVAAWALMAELGSKLPRTVDGDEGHEGGTGSQDPPATPPAGDGGTGGAPDLPGTGGPQKGVQRSDHAPAGEWAAGDVTGTDAVEHPDDADRALDECHVSGCVEPSTHSTEDHVGWSQRRRAAKPEEPTEIVDAELVEEADGSAADGADGYLEADPSDQGVPDKTKTAAQVARDEARRAAHEAKERADEQARADEAAAAKPTRARKSTPPKP